ncbi:hypothetical protein POKO110462_00145 [Pontibacter korlensis]|uniref:Uncharacterized protein n=1 Tax=Pontibacter korlensis TaxID=400092 RepID=A0A0E3UWI2_9BACT|nr:hypothetical protein [Pontibacter korlensis]AKD02706.1 hypothetical protein PKOR_05675 [Pontibacter korlensis]
MKTAALIFAILVSLYIACKDFLQEAKPKFETPSLVAARQQWLATATTPVIASAYTQIVG